MKNKLTKKNMTKFDYSARRLGIVGAALLVLSFAVALPIATSVSSANNNMKMEIQQLHDEINNDNYVVETK
jgi:hypothetical protein